MYELFKNGKAKSTPGDSITEGIGLGRVTPVIETAKVDDAFLVSDEEAVNVIYDLLEHEGLCLGGSTGINVAGAIKLAKQLGPGKTIVTILCRLRQPLSVEAVQSGIHALEEPAGAGMAGEADQDRRAVREGVTCAVIAGAMRSSESRISIFGVLDRFGHSLAMTRSITAKSG